MITWPEFQIPAINVWNVWYLQAKQEEGDDNIPMKNNKAFCEGRTRMFTTLYNQRNSNAT